MRPTLAGRGSDPPSASGGDGRGEKRVHVLHGAETGPDPCHGGVREDHT